MNTMSDQLHADSQKDPRHLERELDARRDHIADLVRALEQRLSPGDMIDRVLRSGGSGGGEFARQLGQTVRDNPVPTLLASAGLLWLFASRNDSPGGATGANVSGMTYTGDPADKSNGAPSSGGRMAAMGEHARHAGADVRATLHDVRDGAGHKLDKARDSVQTQVARTRTGFEHLLHDNPMAVGALAVAVGALMGAVVPTTRREDELMGGVGTRLREGADAVMEEARGISRDVVQEAKAAQDGSKGNKASDASASRDGTHEQGDPPSARTFAGDTHV